MQESVIRLEHITREFPGVLANDDVSLEIRRGEVFALVGENGAGKSTLMNIIYGIFPPTDGSVYIRGKKVETFSPKNSIEMGIGMVHQHFMLVPSFTVAQNIVMSREPRRAGIFFDNKRAEEITRELVDEYGLYVDPSAPVQDVSVGVQQRVEILKALYRGADILILDEPTAVLTPQETEKLFAVLRNMRDDGKAIVIITHKLHEVEELSDRVAILRHGHFVGDMPTKKTNAGEMTNMMVGRPVVLNINRPEPKNPQRRLEVKHLTVLDEDGVTKLDDVSFTAYSGEILGVAGISGSGQKELLEAIAGLHRAEGGSIVYVDPATGSEEELIGKDPRDISDMGVALSFVPEDRLGMGLVGDMDLSDNMMLRSFRRGRGFFTDRKSPHKLAERVVEELEVNTPSIETPVRRLSGGNVQKVLVGREISSAPTVLLTAYAVRGLDINSSYTIYDLINKQKERGVAVVYVGEDLDVLLELADRILVLCGGKVSGIIPGRGATKRRVGLMMTRLGGGDGDE